MKTRTYNGPFPRPGDGNPYASRFSGLVLKTKHFDKLLTVVCKLLVPWAGAPTKAPGRGDNDDTQH